jgi:ankyrin repeat protein
MKRLIFTIAATAALVALGAPATAQFVSSASKDFLDAVRKADLGTAQDLLRGRPSGLINAKTDDGNTALVMVIQRRDDDWTAFLLDKGADPDLPGKGGEIPLTAAARVGAESAIEWLIGLGAKVDGTNRQGETALIVAVQLREAAIVRQLLAAGANPDKTDHAQGYSARDYAARDTRGREILKTITDKKPKT